MAKQDVLARVKADLSVGRTHVARQRLRTLLANDPGDLEVRELLADAYRQSGNLVEAGRWAFLSPELRPDEAVAFEHAHPSPWLRLRLLRFTGDAGQLEPAARERLAALTAQAGQSGPPAEWTVAEEWDPAGRPHSNRFPCLFVAVTLLIVGVLVGIGVYRLLHWFIAL